MARRRKRSKKWISRLFFLLLLVAAVVVCYFVWEAYFKEKKEVPKEKENGTQIVKPIEKTDDKKEEKEEEEEPVQKEDVLQYDGEDPNEQGGLTGVITYLGVSGSDLIVRVNIDQYLTSGSCEINVIKGGEVLYTSLAAVIDSASTSTCEGFNVPIERLSSGKIQVNINVSSGEKTGVISGEAEV
jgi:hypothetical protein